jgi:hypothetical protein
MFTKILLATLFSVSLAFGGIGVANWASADQDDSTVNPALSSEAKSCCSPTATTTQDKADCCKKNLACCEKGKTRACCVATTKLGCCAKGLKCCETNSACCSAVQECCREGAACCNDGKACCGKVVN